VWGTEGIDYRAILGFSAPQICEQGAGFAYTERHLQCTWYDSLYRPGALETVDGEALTVHDPGHWNLAAGPDFLDAVLSVAPNRRRLKGDVEVHVRPGDWHAHGHAEDPRYRHVAAHITYFPGRLPPDSLPPGAVQVSLKPFLANDPLFSFECIDVTAYPYAARPPKPLPCAQIISALSPERSIELLEEAGRERLETKARRAAAGIKEKGLDQQFYEDFLYALGYKQNRVPFRQLARRLPLERLNEEADGNCLRGYALLLGVSGLMPSSTDTRWDGETRLFVRGLWDIWWKKQNDWAGRSISPSVWCRSGIRPQNHPVRRLAAAAALFCRSDSIAQQVLDLDTANAKDWYRRAAGLLETACVMPYWKHRLGFTGTAARSEVALLGSWRVAAILSNVFVPFLKALNQPTDSLLQHLPAEQDNSLIRRTAHSLFGRDHNPACYRTGLRQQGLLQIFYDFCLNDRNACRNCRLAEALGRMSVK